MSMAYYHGRYWADLRPVRSADGASVLYWQYKIYEAVSDKFLFDGHDADYESARITAEAHIEQLNEEDRKIQPAA